MPIVTDLAADFHALTAGLAALGPPGIPLWIQALTPTGSMAGAYEVAFAVRYGKLTVTYWATHGSACWRVERYVLRGDRLELDVSRRLGGEQGRLIVTSLDNPSPAVVGAADGMLWRRFVQSWLQRWLPPGVPAKRMSRRPGPVVGWQASRTDGIWLIFTTVGSDEAAARQLLGQALQALGTVSSVARLCFVLPPGALVHIMSFLSWLTLPQLQVYEATADWSRVRPVAISHQLPLVTEPIRRWRYLPPTEAELDNLREWFGDALTQHCEVVPVGTTTLSIRWYGLECARIRRTAQGHSPPAALRFGLTTLGEPEHQLTARTRADFEALLASLSRYRTPVAREVGHPLYRAYPERWLDVVIRRNLAVLDDALEPTHIWGQSPHFSRDAVGLADFVTLTRAGQLAVVELKAVADADLIWQGLNYWLRAVHHWRRGDFIRRGYFTATRLDVAALPWLYLVAPTLRFHRVVRAVAHRLNQSVPLVLVGVNERWRESLRVVFREHFGTVRSKLPE